MRNTRIEAFEEKFLFSRETQKEEISYSGGKLLQLFDNEKLESPRYQLYLKVGDREYEISERQSDMLLSIKIRMIRATGILIEIQEPEGEKSLLFHIVDLPEMHYSYKTPEQDFSLLLWFYNQYNQAVIFADTSSSSYPVAFFERPTMPKCSVYAFPVFRIVRKLIGKGEC